MLRTTDRRGYKKKTRKESESVCQMNYKLNNKLDLEIARDRVNCSQITFTHTNRPEHIYLIK